jgi:tripartite-type tricarboxylate transporter receptor subunit TctC
MIHFIQVARKRRPSEVRNVVKGLIAIGVLAAVAMTTPAHSEYPDRTIRLIVPFAPGGANDSVARLVSDTLGKMIGQSVVVENRPGGGTIIGTAAVASAHPDGYTLLLVSPAHTINPHIHKTLPFDPLADFTPIAQITRSAYVLVTAANSPIGSVGDLIASARHRDAPFTYGSSGVGSAPHLAGHLLARLGGVKAIHVPYLGGSPAMVGVIRGDVDVYFSSLSGAHSFVQSKQAKALAVSSSFRVRTFPNVPTVSETGIADYAVNGWYGVIGPAGLPIEVVTRLEDGIHRSLQDPELVARLEREGEEVSTGTADAFAALIRSDLERYRTIVKSAGLTPQ